MNINIVLENWTSTLHGKRGKVEVLICRILYKFSLNFLFSRSTFTFYIIHFIVYNTSYVQNIWWKLIKTVYLKWKELNQVIIGKGHFCFTKGLLDAPEGQVEVEFLVIGNCFWHLSKEKSFFFQKDTFPKKRPIPWRFIFLKKAMLMLMLRLSSLNLKIFA